ncbi:hepatocyte nuclear factor 4-beta-like isoform X1 [Centruroides sculpturatus]|uniref:hepatocyte nuclear factor 4-beta-like isoform X1 n=1 Tax=Centruroides sculpturatus TaxID=218467 RepID=UPI000C6D8DC9|nr:hepatocyte nuclear factor 4-beta-like isoform X1 [Centruroides sculpturatus]
MCTIDQIEQFRLSRVIHSSCVVCGHEAYSDYYGNFACKKCIKFFLRSIHFRKIYKCKTNSGKCRNIYDKSPSCKFCFLEEMYKLGLNPIRFGRHDKGWYMKDKIPNLRRVPVIGELEWNTKAWRDFYRLISYMHKKILNFVRWTNENPPISGPLEIDLQDLQYLQYVRRGILVGMISDSLHRHDVLKVGNLYCDPYKCEHIYVQRFTSDILNIKREFDQIFQKNTLSVEEKKMIIYVSHFQFLGEVEQLIIQQ